MKKLFTTESVRMGHPDKLCDLISDSILDAYLKEDKDSRVAVEVMTYKTGILVSGEITSTKDIDIKEIVRNTLNKVGYNDDKLLYNYKNLDINVSVSKQSPDISQGVNKEILGAGDQGIMFGYATDETEEYMPIGTILVNNISKVFNIYELINFNSILRCNLIAVASGIILIVIYVFIKIIVKKRGDKNEISQNVN